MADSASCSDLAVDLAVLRRRGRHLEQPVLAQPGVLAALGEERADARDDPVAGRAEAKRRLVAEEVAERRQVRPVPVAEAAVPAARPPAAELRLEQRDARWIGKRAQRERRPEAREPAADDRDVDLEVAVERRRAVAVVGVAQPPRRLAAGEDGRLHAGTGAAIGAATSCGRAGSSATTTLVVATPTHCQPVSTCPNLK